MKKGKKVGDIEVVAEIRKLDYEIEKPDQFAMDPSQISMVAYYCGLPGDGKPMPLHESHVSHGVPKLKTQSNGATYPLGFLLDFLKLASKSGATHIQLASGRNTPLWACAVIEVECGESTQPARTLEFALAPRIETGEDGMAEVKGIMFEVVTDEKKTETGMATDNPVPE